MPRRVINGVMIGSRKKWPPAVARIIKKTLPSLLFSLYVRLIISKSLNSIGIIVHVRDMYVLIHDIKTKFELEYFV